MGPQFYLREKVPSPLKAKKVDHHKKKKKKHKKEDTNKNLKENLLHNTSQFLKFLKSNLRKSTNKMFTSKESKIEIQIHTTSITYQLEMNKPFQNILQILGVRQFQK